MHLPASKCKGYRAGVTLVETLVVLGVMVLLVFGASALITGGFRYNTVLSDNLQTQTEGRRTLRAVADAIRRAEDSSIGSYAIADADDDAFIFYANMDDDSARERVRFFLQDTTFKQGIIKASGNPLTYPSANEVVIDLAFDVINTAQNVPVFTYYDASFTGASAPLADPVAMTDIRGINVQLVIDKDPNKTPVPLTVDTFVSMRNLKEE